LFASPLTFKELIFYGHFLMGGIYGAYVLRHCYIKGTAGLYKASFSGDED